MGEECDGEETLQKSADELADILRKDDENGPPAEGNEEKKDGEVFGGDEEGKEGEVDLERGEEGKEGDGNEGAEEEKEGEGEGDEEEEYGEEEEDNSCIEIYFQPKFQGNKDREKLFKIRCKLEVLHAFLDESFYDDMRTKQ